MITSLIVSVYRLMIIQDMKILEDNVEQTLLREEQALEAEEADPSGTMDDVSALQKSMRDMKAKYEVSAEDQGFLGSSLILI